MLLCLGGIPTTDPFRGAGWAPDNRFSWVGRNSEVGQTLWQLVGTSWTGDAGNIYVAYFHPCITLTGIPLLVLGHLWGVRALIWLQIELRCGSFNPAAFQSQEVASEHVACVSIFPRPHIVTRRAWRESLT